MNTKYNNKLIVLIVLLLITMFMILVPRDYSSSLILTYIVTIAMGIFFLLVWESAGISRDHKLFLNIPSVLVALFFFIIQIVLFTILMIVPFLDFKFVILVNATSISVLLIIIIMLSSSTKYIDETYKYVNKKTGVIKVFTELLDNEIFGESDKEILTLLHDLKEEIQFSDPISHESVGVIEDQIYNSIILLSDQEKGKKVEAIEKIRKLVKKRNFETKLKKLDMGE